MTVAGFTAPPVPLVARRGVGAARSEGRRGGVELRYHRLGLVDGHGPVTRWVDGRLLAGVRILRCVCFVAGVSWWTLLARHGGGCRR